jgi:hypothetical protein
MGPELRFHEVDLERLDSLLRDLEDTPNAIMREHLEAARYYLLGGMPQEYHFALNLAEENLPAVEDKGLRDRIANYLAARKAAETPAATSRAAGESSPPA